MVGPTLVPMTFVGGTVGSWIVERIDAVRGEPLAPVERVELHPGEVLADGTWHLRGVTSHVRYLERREKPSLDAVTPALGRPEITRAVLIPIRKTAQWWAMTQDERRAIFEEQSHHISGSMKYLPRIARRLYHARDLGEPFDFLTWFEFATEHASAFDELVSMLRGTEEWRYVEREVEVRLSQPARSVTGA